MHGTRIIAARVLESAGCPVVNMHAGITLRYRGVHGGYWALAEQHPDWVGTTVHLVDPGIDTGGILAQTTFEVSDEDTIATYPDLHLVHGLPLLGAQVDKVMAGTELEPLRSKRRPWIGLLLPPHALGLPLASLARRGAMNRRRVAGSRLGPRVVHYHRCRREVRGHARARSRAAVVKRSGTMKMWEG